MHILHAYHVLFFDFFRGIGRGFGQRRRRKEKDPTRREVLSLFSVCNYGEVTESSAAAAAKDDRDQDDDQPAIVVAAEERIKASHFISSLHR